MARRSKDWNIGLAEDLRNREFARASLLRLEVPILEET